MPHHRKREYFEIFCYALEVEGDFAFSILIDDNFSDYYMWFRENYDWCMPEIAKKAFHYFEEDRKADLTFIEDKEGFVWRCSKTRLIVS